jgi:hypothetical protein
LFSQISRIPFIRDINTSDIDQDGNPDLVIAAEWQPLLVFLNNGKRFSRVSSPALDELKGWWQSVTITDLNQDGKADLIAGNWGLNNKFNVSKKSPLLAYNQDFDQNGRNDLILSYFHKGKYYPFRQKSDLDMEVPLLKKEWLSYGKMADKTTPEIFNIDQNSYALSSNFFKSIFISDILHEQEVRELPYLYQQSPVKSVLSSKISGKKELIVSGNMWSVIPYEGKYDALGLASVSYDAEGTFNSPQYWINPLLNFEEVTYIAPLSARGKTNWLVLTYGGKVLVVSDAEDAVD